ncbi:MAG: hypothetical protein PHU04_00600 [Candidatus Peribacteraceae bacterium]|nr:hypothetical protein [Candidatus Peribacteraceae bacterium]
MFPKTTRTTITRLFVSTTIGLLLLRIGVLILRSPLPPDLPFGTRELHTIGIAIRYWSRWTVENSNNPWYLPALLQSGDNTGILPTEFPLLNLILAPSFMLGIENGRIIAYLMIILMFFGLSWINYKAWKGVTVANRDISPAMLILPIFSIAASVSGKIMPDYFAMILGTLAVGLFLSREKIFFPILLGSTALLVKPTSIIVFFLLVLRQKHLREVFSTRFALRNMWVGIPMIVCLTYYTLGIGYIKNYQDISDLFWMTLDTNFITSLSSFLSQPMQLITFIGYHWFFILGVPLYVCICIYLLIKEKRKVFSALWLLVFLQVAIITMLNVQHPFIHYYYYVGISPLCAIIFYQFLLRVRVKMVLFLFMGLLATHLLVLSHFDLRGYYNVMPMVFTKHFKNKFDYMTYKRNATYSECALLKKRNPNFPWGRGEVFRSTYSRMADIGVCFGERQNSTEAEYGFYKFNDSIPSECIVVDQEKHFKLVRCDT